MVETVARALILAAVTIALAGVLIWAGTRLGLGRLPGDILIDRGNVKILVPVATGIVVSIVLTVVLNVAVRLWR